MRDVLIFSILLLVGVVFGVAVRLMVVGAWGLLAAIVAYAIFHQICVWLAGKSWRLSRQIFGKDKIHKSATPNADEIKENQRSALYAIPVGFLLGLLAKVSWL